MIWAGTDILIHWADGSVSRGFDAPQELTPACIPIEDLEELFCRDGRFRRDYDGRFIHYRERPGRGK